MPRARFSTPEAAETAVQQWLGCIQGSSGQSAPENWSSDAFLRNLLLSDLRCDKIELHGRVMRVAPISEEKFHFELPVDIKDGLILLKMQ